MQPLDAKVAIVTGAGQNIGRAIALELAPRGITCNCVSPGANDTVRGDSARVTHHASPGAP